MPGSDVRRYMRNSFRRAWANTEWNVFGARVFEPKFQNPGQPVKPAKPSQECCVEEREAWRKRTRITELPVASQEQDKRKARLRLQSKQPVRESPPIKGSAPFLLLPPELREQIYIYCIEAHGEQRLTPFRLPALNGDTYPEGSYYKPIPPHEPPITRVSRLVREESVPLFYSTHRFPLVAHLQPNFHYKAVDWYHHLDPGHVKAIRKLEVYFCFEKCDRKLHNIRSPDAFILKVDFDQQTNSYNSVRQDYISPKAAYGTRLVNLHALQQAIMEGLNAIVAGVGVGHFTARDFDRLIPAEQHNSG